jgi:hypothetical protein
MQMRGSEIFRRVVAVVAIDVVHQALMPPARKRLETDCHHQLSAEVARPRRGTVGIDKGLAIGGHHTKLRSGHDRPDGRAGDQRDTSLAIAQRLYHDRR